MLRKEFIQLHGGTCDNWSWSWSFVNHKDKLVIFGAWDTNTQGGSELILDCSWERSSKGRINAGYSQAIKHIHLVEEGGYKLMTFPIIFSGKNIDINGHGPAKIKGFIPKLNQRSLKKIDDQWYAITLPIQEKLTRLCWNSNNWKNPSGKNGKSNHPDTYEAQNGYGHEEWLLDISKLINGYHYGFIQAIAKNRDRYYGQIFNLSFYSINSDTKQRWWIGKINNLHIVGSDESKFIYEFYKNSGWHKEMIEDLTLAGASVDAFQTFTSPENFAVIKYRPQDLELLDQPLEFSSEDNAVPSNRYNLINFIDQPNLFNHGHFQFRPGHHERSGRSKSTYSSFSGKKDLLHNRIQTELFKYLVSTHGKENVGTECPTGNGTFIDVVTKCDNNYTFYEIKTSQSVTQCIRDAIGQLLEYAHLGRVVPIEQLVIVAPYQITHIARQYLSVLNKTYGLPIIYRQFKLDELILAE